MAVSTRGKKKTKFYGTNQGKKEAGVWVPRKKLEKGAAENLANSFERDEGKQKKSKHVRPSGKPTKTQSVCTKRGDFPQAKGGVAPGKKP